MQSERTPSLLPGSHQGTAKERDHQLIRGSPDSGRAQLSASIARATGTLLESLLLMACIWHVAACLSGVDSLKGFTPGKPPGHRENTPFIDFELRKGSSRSLGSGPKEEMKDQTSVK